MIRVTDAEILEALVACKGNQSEASRRLNIQRRQFIRRLAEIRGEKAKPARHRSVTVPIDWYWWLRRTMRELDMPTMGETTVKIFTDWRDSR